MHFTNPSPFSSPPLTSNYHHFSPPSLLDFPNPHHSTSSPFTAYLHFINPLFISFSPSISHYSIIIIHIPYLHLTNPILYFILSLDLTNHHLPSCSSFPSSNLPIPSSSYPSSLISISSTSHHFSPPIPFAFYSPFCLLPLYFTLRSSNAMFLLPYFHHFTNHPLLFPPLP